ncbi:MAG: 3 beta-hydroxysteroid dehydrogenase/Delta 5--_4-isomerase [Bacteroidetes bacterium ADurb.Bin037]|nr:MAG: 3 beta-hydroxysteroid dehydrogenase/Delta 5-->4-isomerase [Bacteroidetes bacterium ADurb.Bin037]HPW78455.1 NAD-dependent epimerase/dehydratase family protein [Bacteroidales bacterium]HQB55917.1 NAD-dependent epimerase/dehydratase family protein [Bacteroidales bacterium]
MQKQEIYLVTGATGHLGFTIVSQLIADGKKVRALVLPDDLLNSRLPSQVEICYGNILDPLSLEKFFRVSPDTEIFVIHAAGIVTTSLKYQPIVYNVNVKGTKNITDAAIKFKATKLVYISSVHAIPEQPIGQVIREINHFDKDLVYGMYAKTKAEATQYVLNAVQEGLDVTVIHPSGICGPNSYTRNYATQLVLSCWSGLLPMGVDGGYDFVDVRDVASGTISSCRKGGRGKCYILSNRYLSIKEFFQTFQQITGKKLPKIMAPMWLAKAVLPVSTLYYKIKKRIPLFSTYSLYTLTANSMFSSDKARLELAYTTRPFEDTLADTIEWLKKEKIIF